MLKPRSYCQKLTLCVLMLIVNCLQAFSQDSRNIFAFVSDTQAPLFVERWFIKSNRNEEATSAILSNIIAQKGLKALFHMGDITSMGSMNSAWEAVDPYLKQLKDLNIPVYPAMGNHDYFLFKDLALEKFRKRFPEIKSSW
jgi:hypothetical protein